MVDTVKTLTDILTNIPINQNGAISAQDLRDAVVSLWQAGVVEWASSRNYLTGQTVYRTGGGIYRANANIPAMTAFAEGSTGATWTQVASLGAAVDLTPLLTAIGENSGKIATNETNIGTLEGKVTALENAAPSPSGGMDSTARQGVMDNAAAITAVSGRVTTLEDEPAPDLTGIGTNAAAITAITGRVTTAEGDITDLEGKVTALEGAPAPDLSGIATNAAAITAVTGRVDGAEADIGDLEGKVTALENAPSTNQFAPTDEAKLKKLSSDTTVNADAVIFNSDVSVDPANVSHSENDFTGTPLVLTLNAFPNADGSTGKDGDLLWWRECKIRGIDWRDA